MGSDRSSSKGAMNGMPVRWLALSLGALAALVYSATAQWGAEQNVDAIAAALPAWSFAETGSLALPDFATANPWVIPSDIGDVSNRPPSVWLAAVPVYFLVRPFTSGFTFWPATFTAVITTAGAIVSMFLLLTRVVDRRLAYVASLILAFGTATWGVSGSELWPHGTTQLWLVLGMIAIARSRLILAGCAAGITILARPPLALVAAVQGCYLSWRDRSLAPLLRIGGPSAVGLFLFLLYNRLLFGAWTLTGGYAAADNYSLAVRSLSGWFTNLFAVFVAPYHGVLLWSPILLVLLPAIPSGWKSSPSWVRASLAGGVLYIAFHAWLNRASGGMAFNYRYPLPSITLAVPALTLSFRAHATNRLRRRLVVAGAVVSVLIQFLYVTTMECVYTSETQVSCSIFRL